MASSGLLEAVNSVLTQIGAIPYDWGAVSIVRSRPNNLFQLVRMWNDQVNRQKSGDGYTFEEPACFVEIVNMANESLLDGVTMADYIWRLHLVAVQLDDAAGNMDQNLQVITYRDALKQAMGGFTPTNCSTMFAVTEEQDYSHSDVYHYILGMKSCFVDTKGSFRDPDQTQFITKEPDTNAQLNSDFDEEAPVLTLEIIPPA